MLNQAPTEEQLLNGEDQSTLDSTLEASVTQSTRSGTTSVSGLTTSFGMSTSMDATSSYSLKSSASGATLAPSSLSGSFTTSRTKSSLKKTPTKKYTPTKSSKDVAGYLGYNKLRLDSAVSPKHSPRSSVLGNEKVSKIFYYIIKISKSVRKKTYKFRFLGALSRKSNR